jgi:hypothetical protein
LGWCMGSCRGGSGSAGALAGVLRVAAGVLRAPRARDAAGADARLGTAGEPLPAAGPPFSCAPGGEGAERSVGVGDARLSLRRFGRLRGSAPSTSEGRSSLNPRQSWRKALRAALRNAVLAKSEQELKPP